MSPSPKKYDVFISFRGEDTRTGFTSHLYNALCKESIETFIDNNLERGDDVWPKIAEAIQGSDISLVVFSRNYASSKWCLEELREILECRKNRGQVVIPVFYKIDPSHIRKQTKSYQKALAKHERDARNNQFDQQKVSQWRAALTEAANISGWDSSNDQDDYQFTKSIVKDVLQKHSLMYPHELKDLVEIDENKQCMEVILYMYQRIGIWGMGGLGKTTIAREMFAKHFAQYDIVCFLENVRGQTEKSGFDSVREKLFSELLKREITSSDVHRPTLIQRRVSSKKVFIVLDDVDDATELEQLCGVLSDLRSDSRLIITSRDRHMLSTRVDQIYTVTKWKDAESLKLFSLGAFEQSHPKEGYVRLSKRAVAYAGGVPLTLKVLGLHFRKKSIEFCESELKYLETKKEYLDKIKNVLRVSYNSLTQREQTIFLDIAFFFKDENKDFVIRILDAYERNFNSSSGIEILEDKALINISNSKRIQMHDLLQEMALDIVGKESSLPGERSRLRNIEEVRDVLENSKRADAVKGITLDLSQKVDLHLQADTFKVMTKLRFLRLYVPLGKKRSAKVYHPGFLELFSKELRYLEWNGYPLKSLPPNFCAEFLVEIRMPQSHIQELWQGRQELPNLETIDLSECKQFIKLPDLSRASKLNRVFLSGCESLCAIHPSLLCVKTLETLILKGCKKLESLMSGKHFSGLQKLDVDGCSSLLDFSISSDSIERLDLSKTGVRYLDRSIGLQNRLLWLSLGGLSLQNFPDELSWLHSLEEFRISKCEPVNKEKLHVLCDGLRSLKVLHLKDCYQLFELPDNINALSSLQELRLDGSSVKKLPASIKLLENLEILSLENCWHLHSLPKLPPFIKELYAMNCISLVTVSTLKTFSVQMKGKEKHIDFKNGTILNDLSLLQIMEDVHFTMKSAALHNVLVRRFNLDTHSHNYNSVGVCLPGSSVPEWFIYQTTESSVIIELPDLDQCSHLLGLIYCAVLSPSSVMEHSEVRFLINGSECGYTETWHHDITGELGSDHVFVWYDPFHCDPILNRFERNKRFELGIKAEGGENDVPVQIKEFGVHIICGSDLELHSLLREAANLEFELKSQLGLKFLLAWDWLNGSNRELTAVLCLALENGYELDEPLKSELESQCQAVLTLMEKESSGEGTQIPNKEQKLSDRILESNSETVIPDSVEEGNGMKDHYSDMKEGIESSSKEIKTSAEGGHGQIIITEPTNTVNSKGNEGTTTELDAGLHVPVVSVDEENALKDKSNEDNYYWPNNIEETKHSEENPNPQGGQVNVPLTNDLIIKEPYDEKENEPVDLGKHEGEDESDENPFAELESILLGSPKSSAEETCSTSDVTIQEALPKLECLLENSLESILGNVELQQQLLISLKCIQQASEENVSPNVAKLVESMTSSIEDLFKDFLWTQKVVHDYTSLLEQKEKLIQQMSDAKKRKELVEKEKSQCEAETKHLDQEAKKLDEKNQLVERNKMIELEKTKLKETMERCDREKKNLEDEAKSMITESKELKSVTKVSESSYDAALSKQDKLNDKWEGFRTAFAEKRGSR